MCGYYSNDGPVNIKDQLTDYLRFKAGQKMGAPSEMPMLLQKPGEGGQRWGLRVSTCSCKDTGLLTGALAQCLKQVFEDTV